MNTYPLEFLGTYVKPTLAESSRTLFQTFTLLDRSYVIGFVY